jgi:Tol biopolymer transport system component
MRSINVNHLRRAAYILAGLLVLLALGAAALIWRGSLFGVRVVEWAPAGKDAVSSTTALRITFSQPMRQAETESRFRIDPPVEGRFEWQDNTLVFRPRYALSPGQAYTVTLAAGAPGQRGRPVRRDVTWRFTVRHPRLVYLAFDESDVLQLYAAGDPAPQQLTFAGSDVWDYAVHPEGTSIAYSVVREDDGADLWLVDDDGGEARLLLRCPEASCTAPAWSADGKQIAYERKDLSQTVIGLHSGPLSAHIWLLDPLTGETGPLFAEAPTPGRGPTWSPTGQRLAFYDQSAGAVQIYDLGTGEQQFFDTLVGIGTWSPTGEQMVIPDMAFHGEHSDEYLVRVDLSTRAVQDLRGSSTANDYTPHWSPAGEWIAFGRTALADGARTWGAQLWLMRPDGSEARALVAEAQANFGAFAWRPDGRALAYVRLDIDEMADPHPELWVFSLEDGQELIATDVILPGWLP